MLHRLSIRAILGGTIIAMGALIIVMAGTNLNASTGHYRAVIRVVDLATIDGDIFNAMSTMRIERAAIVGALPAKIVAEPEAIARIAQFRERSEASYTHAAALLGPVAATDSELAATFARLRDAHDAMAALRSRADTMIGQDLARRDPEVIRSAPAVSQAYQDALVAVGDRLEATMKLVSPAIDELVAIKRAAWTARMTGGSLGIRVDGFAATARALPQTDLLANAADRGAILLSWSELAELTARPEVPSAVADAMRRAASMFPSTFLAGEDQAIRDLAEHPDRLSVPFAEMQQHNADTFGAVADVATIALRETADLAARQAGDARGELVASIMAALLALGLTVSGYLIAVRRVSAPIGAMTEAMRRLSDHDLTVAIPHAGRSDEIGGMARAVEVFRESMVRADTLSAERDSAAAARQRRHAALDRHTQEFGTSVSGVMVSLAASAGEMRRAAGAMTEAAAGVHQRAGDTVDSGGQASRDLTAVAAAVEQLTASVDEISRQVAAAAQVAQEAVRRAEAGHETMRGLSEATARIGDVVLLISDIAGQTNLLALNATIEAARAGDAGKGFAVVAGEVKALAGQTAKATADIGGQIGAVRDATEQSITAMTEVAAVIGRIDAVASAIAAAVEEQSTTTRGIAASIQTVSGATDSTVQAMREVAGLADDAGQVSQEVLRAATGIGKEAETLRVEVDQFLSTVRDDGGERRGFERIPGNGVNVTLRVPGRPAVTVPLRDLSRGGAALRYEQSLSAGSHIEMELPAAGGVVPARVARCEQGTLGIVFQQEPAALARIDRALAALSQAVAA